MRVIEAEPNKEIVPMLRALADEIEAGDQGADQIVLVLDTGSNVEVRGYGKMDGMHAIGLLQLGIQRLAGDTIRALDEK